MTLLAWVCLFLKKFIYVLEKEREREEGGGAEEENPQADTPLSRNPNVGLHLITLKS